MQLSTRNGAEAPIEPIVGSKGDSTRYHVLEVSPRASKAVIQAAYRALARTAHPDCNRGAAAERMRELNRARDILLDPRRRVLGAGRYGRLGGRAQVDAGAFPFGYHRSAEKP